MNIALKNITKHYGKLCVFSNFSAEFERGKITCILGKSGSGKTTLLSILSRLTDFEGTAEGIPQNISYIFQKERLLPSLTVRGNLEYVLKSAIPDMAQRALSIENMLRLVELSGFSDKYPRELSGGMQQRVSMARAFCYPSKLLLMDEPFRSLDVALKRRLTEQFIGIWKADRRTAVLVTHDIDEAVSMADKIVILGGNPSSVIKTFEISISQWQRDLSEKALLAVRGEIYSVLSTL